MDFDPNAPAFGTGAQVISEAEPTEEAEVTPVAAEEAEPEEVVTPSEEESKVPYSRFKKFHDEAKEYQAQAEFWRQQAESLKSQPSPQVTENPEVPDYWVQLYGDSPESLKAWKIQEQQNEKIKEEARQEALKAIEERSYQEETRTKENLNVIVSNLEALSDYVGRQLTEKEQSAVLDIVDEYTPQDEHGNYLGATIPFEKAWEIYELKNQATKSPKTQARNQVANLTGSNSQGPVGDSERNDNFDPSWGALGTAIRNRLN